MYIFVRLLVCSDGVFAKASAHQWSSAVTPKFANTLAKTQQQAAAELHLIVLF